MNLEQAINEYLISISINEGKSQRTVSSYGRDLAQYRAFLEENGIMDTSDVKSSDIDVFLKHQRQTKKATSIARMAASIRSFHHFMNFMHNENDPSLILEVHRGVKDLPVFCTIDEINKIMGYFNDDEALDVFHHSILEIIYTCGLRVSEAANLEYNRVDLDTGMVRILGKGNKERVVPIPSGSISILKKYRDEVRPLWVKNRNSLFFINSFGRKVTTRSIELLLKEVCDAVGIKKHITPHKLRHSYATHMLQGGADLRSIQEMLGHSNIQTTEIYTHVQNKQIFQSYEKFHPVDTELELPKEEEDENS